ncbi:CoA-transferase [Rhodococcus pyridinivorans KG-16]|uniref:CoA-transferase n=1 Tax=Rhodococcus pyridinivorans KG-16 TaxID=1441730 RepID=A0A0V9URY4_9NOCA|nr:CoA transferase [Rhodococcus pyridinivorans]KSZ60725.1 CoA-transferase [Rhodococcus pyridinivorans KG-16]
MALPLQNVRVLDLTDGFGDTATRFLADLGAEVVRVELPGGSATRSAEPIRGGVSIPFALRNANKLGVTADLEVDEGRDRLRELARQADILIESMPPGYLASRGVGPADLRRINPELVAVSVTPFGQDGPYRDWAASEQILYALSGVLSRSGEPGEAPLLPPNGLVDESVGVHTAWSALLAYYDRLHTGQGQTVDISAFEVIVHGFDPGFGVQGSAAAGRSEDFPRGRPDAANFYPVYRCADGQVRICLLARRQWRAMFEWLGEPEEFADPKYDTIPARFAASDRLNPLIDALFADYTRDQLVAEGAARGIPIGGLNTVSEVLETDHFEASGTFVDTEIAPGIEARIPSGYAKINGERAGFRFRAPRLGEHDDVVFGSAEREARPQTPAPTRAVGSRPFEGLRVLDLGVVVFGAELGRQFADNGADVIKIENSDFPDGLRQSRRKGALAASVAWGHRNRRSLGLNLRSAEGIAVFKKLAAQADIVLANFKPGTLASMGLSYEELKAINPRIVVSESSAFGSVGPWNTRLGYGPLVRAACGVSALWRYSDDSDGLCDGSTVYPDHIAGQVTAVTVLAVLIDRLRTGQGAAIEVAQADTAIVQLGNQLVAEHLEPGSISAPGNSDPYAAPSGVFACAGDDEWCVVSVRDDTEWLRLCEVLGRTDLAGDPRFASAEARLANRAEVDAVLAEWLAHRSPTEAMETLQSAGVPAGAMVRLPELLTNPQLVAREAYTELEHELLPSRLPTATRVARFDTIPDWPLRPAPLPGQQTREICETVIGLDEAEIDALVRDGVLQPPADDPALSSAAAGV